MYACYMWYVLNVPLIHLHLNAFETNKSYVCTPWRLNKYDIVHVNGDFV